MTLLALVTPAIPTRFTQMVWNYPLLDRLAAGRDPWLAEHPAVERALGVAWDTADTAGRRKLIATLLQRGRPEGLIHLIQRLDQLDAGSQAEMVSRIDQLHRPLRKVLGSSHEGSDAAAQVNALTLIEAADAGDLAYLVTEKLRSPRDEVRQRAVHALLGLVRRVEWMPPVAVQRLTQAVNESVVRFGHHREPAILRAWLGLAPRGLVAGGQVVEALEDTDHPAVGAMRELLRTADGPLIRAGLVPALAISPLCLAAVEGLRRCMKENGWDQALTGRDHLLDLPAVRRGLARAGEPAGLMPEVGVGDATVEASAGWSDGPTDERQDESAGGLPGTFPGEFPGGAWSGLAAWIDALPWSGLTKAARLGQLLDRPGVAARLSATRRLMALGDAAADPAAVLPDPQMAAEVRRLVLTRADDEDPALARLAAAWLLREAKKTCAERGSQAESTVSVLDRSRHAGVRAMARRRRSLTAFDTMWNAWPKLAPADRIDAARTALDLDPHARRRLEVLLRQGGSSRKRAVEIVTLADRHGLLDPSSRPRNHNSNNRNAHDAVPANGGANDSTSSAAPAAPLVAGGSA